MDPVSISATLTSLKLVGDVIKDWRKGDGNVTVTMDTVRDLNSAVLDAQEHAMAVRQAQYDLMQRNAALERELQTLKDWGVERANYECKSVPSYGAYVYAPKPGSELQGANHWLCQLCFENAKKSMLQFVAPILDISSGGMMSVWKCFTCQGEVRVQLHMTPSAAN